MGKLLRSVCWIFSLYMLAGFCQSVYAQGTSNKGTDFWVAYTAHIDGKTSKMTLFLSSPVNTTYQVEGAGKVISSGTIQANVVTAVFVNPLQFDVYLSGSDMVESNKGIHITTKDDISVYCVISNNARTGGSLILPTKALGREYYTFSYHNEGTTISSSQFAIMAVEDNTEVEITPRVDNIQNNRKANAAYTINLNKGDIYQFQSIMDVSGSLIRTLGDCKPIAVFSGSTWTAFCELGNTQTNPSGGDNLYQQLFPVSAWGKNFVTAPFYNTENGNVDVLRIIVSEDNTVINVNGSTASALGTPLSNPYKKGSIVTFFSRVPAVIKADKPIGVAQYQTSQNCNTANLNPGPSAQVAFPGDPEMTILNPIEQTLNEITVFSKLNEVSGVRTNINKYYLNIIIKTKDAPSLKVDKNPVTGFLKIDNEYSYVIVDVTNSVGQHHIIANGGFVAIAYGYGSVESYSYLAGADVKNLFQTITANNSSGLEVATGCINQSSNFTLKLPYKTSSIIWNIDQDGSSLQETNPAFNTTVIDGKTVYLYKYPKAGPLYTAAGKYKLIATVLNPAPSGCNALEVVSVDFEITDPPKAEFTGPAQSCKGSFINFKDNSTGRITGWLWDFGDGSPKSTAQDPEHVYAAGGNYTVKLIVTNEAGCSSLTATHSISISGQSGSKLSFSPVPEVCLEATPFRITQAKDENGQSGTSVFSGPGVSPEGLFSPALAGVGTHTITFAFTSINGCTDKIAQQITVKPSPVVNAGRDTVVLEGKMVQLKAIASGSNLKYKWFPSGGLDRDDIAEPQASPAEDQIYTLVVTSDQGCIATSTLQVKVLRMPVAPNSFSPNGDGVNDTWTVKNLSNYPNPTLQIFSRSGGRIFSSISGSEITWDGTVNGIELPVGTYYYVIKPGSGRESISGSVTILR